MYLILNTFLGISCIQDTTLKVLLKFINEHLLLFTSIYYYLGSGFFGFWSQDGTYIANWLLFSSCLATLNR